jgi:hypothetical protein
MAEKEELLLWKDWIERSQIRSDVGCLMWLKWRFFLGIFLITVLCSFLLIVLAKSIGEKNKRFHFEAGWVKHKDHKKIVNKVWRIKDSFADKWAVLRRKLDICIKD